MSTAIVQSGAFISSSLSFERTLSYHVEAFKVLEGEWFRIDPTPFLQPLMGPQVNVQFDCNDVVVYVGGTVVERRALLESTDVVMEMMGNPLVQGSYIHIAERVGVFSQGYRTCNYLNSSLQVMIVY